MLILGLIILVFQIAQLKVKLIQSYSTIYVKFDDSNADNSLKGRGLCGELKECVTVTARKTGFL